MPYACAGHNDGIEVLWLVAGASSPACRVNKKLHPTSWLESLPQSTLVDLMQRRYRYLAAAAVRSLDIKSSERIFTLKGLTTPEVAQLGHQIIT
jgi:hypothetical protein